MSYQQGEGEQKTAGSQTIYVPEDLAVVKMDKAGDRSVLEAGKQAFLVVRDGADGSQARHVASGSTELADDGHQSFVRQHANERGIGEPGDQLIRQREAIIVEFRVTGLIDDGSDDDRRPLDRPRHPDRGDNHNRGERGQDRRPAVRSGAPRPHAQDARPAGL